MSSEDYGDSDYEDQSMGDYGSDGSDQGYESDGGFAYSDDDAAGASSPLAKGAKARGDRSLTQPGWALGCGPPPPVPACSPALGLQACRLPKSLACLLLQPAACPCVHPCVPAEDIPSDGQAGAAGAAQGGGGAGAAAGQACAGSVGPRWRVLWEGCSP